MKKINTLTLVQLALLTALIFLLAFVPYIGYIKIPVLAIQATTIHIPVIVGSILLGPKAGAVLGFCFGLTSLINNTTQPSITSFCFSPFISMGEGLGGSPLALIICFVPRILCGVVPHYVYKFLGRFGKDTGKPKKLAMLASGVAGSLTNTILVMSMIYLFFGQQYAAVRAIAFEAVLGVIMSVILINGTLEALVAALLAAAVCLAVQKANVLHRRK